MAKADENRNCEIYAKYAYLLISLARKECVSSDIELAVQGNVNAFDSTVIELCLKMFWYAKYRKSKGAIKIRTLFDVKTNIPCFVYITEASLQDVNVIDEHKYESGSYYVMNKAYVDYCRLFKIQEENTYFVTRAKVNFRFRTIKVNKVSQKIVLCSTRVYLLLGAATQKKYPKMLR